MGFISCFILMVGFSYAANNNIFSVAKFKILVNGNDYKGKPAIVVDGSTYLPLRALGEVLNVKVNWNETKRRVEIGEMPIEATSTPVSTPNPKVSVGKNEFIAHDNMQGRDIFKVSVLGKVSEGSIKDTDIKYEIWKFRFENIDIHEQDILPNRLGWDQGAIMSSVKAPEGYELIKQKKLKPGETWECVAVLTVNSKSEKLRFSYENGRVAYHQE